MNQSFEILETVLEKSDINKNEIDEDDKIDDNTENKIDSIRSFFKDIIENKDKANALSNAVDSTITEYKEKWIDISREMIYWWIFEEEINSNIKIIESWWFDFFWIWFLLKMNWSMSLWNKKV